MDLLALLEVCRVEVDIHAQLVELLQEVLDSGRETRLRLNEYLLNRWPTAD